MTQEERERLLRDAQERTRYRNNLANLEAFNQQMLYQQQVEKATEEEVDSDFWSWQTLENVVDVYGNNFLGTTRKLNTDEDGNYVREQFILGAHIPFLDDELTEEEFIELNKEHQKDYASKSMFLRKVEEFGNFKWNTLRSWVLTGLEASVDVGEFLFGPSKEYTVVEDGKIKQYDFSSKEGQAIAYLDAQIRDEKTPEAKKEELIALRKRLEESPGLIDEAKNWWNNSMVGQYWKTNDAKSLNNRVNQKLADEALRFALYKDKIKVGAVEEFFERAANQRKKRDAFEAFNKNVVRTKEGRPTSLLEDTDLEPLSTEVITDKYGKSHPVERMGSSSNTLFDKERIVTDKHGNVVIDPTTGLPEYERVYSHGRKAWEVLSNLVTTDVGTENTIQGVGSMAEFLGPTVGITTVTTKLLGTSKLARRLTNLSAAAYSNNMESSQQGQDAFTQSYEGKLSEYSGITREKVTEELLRGGATEEDAAILLEARYQRQLKEWADNNQELASKAWGQAVVAGKVAEETNRLLLPLQMFEVGMITKAMRGLKGVPISTASRNILSNPLTVKGVAGKTGKALFEGATEYFEENWNNYAIEKGKHLAAGENYTFADFDMTSAENIESGIMGFVLGAGMGGLSVAADARGQYKSYKEQQKFIKTLDNLPAEIKKSTLSNIITAINAEDAIDLAQQMSQAKREGNTGKLKELSERMLINRTVQSLQNGTAGKFKAILDSIAADEEINEMDRANAAKASSFVSQMADFYDDLAPNVKGKGRLLINQGNLIQVNDAIAEIETMLPGIREHAREVEENKIRTSYRNTPQASERLINMQTSNAVDKNPTVVNAMEQIENLKDYRAELIGEQKRVLSKEYQQKLRRREAQQKVESTLQQANRSNISETVQKVEENQKKPLTTEQKNKIITAVDPVPLKTTGKENIVVSQKAKEVEASGKNQKDEELSTLASAAQNTPDPDQKSNDDWDPDAAEQMSSILNFAPTLYNRNNQAHQNLVNALKDRLQKFDEVRKNIGSNNFDSFKDFYEHIMRSTSAMEAEGMFNMAKEAYKEFNKENYSDRVIETEAEMDSVYNDYFSFATDLRSSNNTSNTQQTISERTSEEVKRDNLEEVKESLSTTNPTPSNLIASTGDELFVVGKKVSSFSFKIPFLGQSYDLLIDRESGTVEFRTNDETILRSAHPFLNWNLFIPGKKVQIVLPTINGKLTQESLSQPMSVWQGGKEIEGGTLKNFLEVLFKGETAENLIEQYTLEQLIEKELEAKETNDWSQSDLVQRVPVNLEANGLDSEDGLGKGLHEVTWWNVSNIADFTEAIMEKEPHLSLEEAKVLSRKMQEKVVQQAKEELTQMRIELIKSPTQSINMRVAAREPGVSLQNTDGVLTSIQESNPSAQIGMLSGKGILTVGGKEFDTKGGRINNIDAIQKLAQSNNKIGASYMIAQVGTEMNEFKEIVPVYTAYEVHNNTTQASEDIRSRQEKLNRIGKMIETAEEVFFGTPSTDMSLNVATQILNRLTGKNVSSMSKVEAGKVIGKVTDLLVGRYSAYPVSYQENGETQYRINIKEGLNNPSASILTEINIETNSSGQEIVSFEEQNYQEYLKENLSTQVKFQEIPNANPDGSSIWINDVQPKIILERDNVAEVEKENKNPIRNEEKIVASKKEQLASIEKQKKYELEKKKDYLNEAYSVGSNKTVEEEINERYNRQIQILEGSPKTTEEIAEEAAQVAKNNQKKSDTSKFNDNHIDTIQQNLFGSTLNNIPLDKDVSLRDVYSILSQQFNNTVKKLRSEGKVVEAQFMEENKEKILGIGTLNYRNSVREELDLFFNTDIDEEIDISNGEIAKNFNKSSFEQPISMSLSMRTKILLAGIKSDSNQGFTPFGGLYVYQPVDNMISALQKAFAEASNNSIDGKGGLIQAMQNRINKSKSKKTGKSPYDFYEQIIFKVKNASPEIQKEIQYHLYNSPVNMYFIQFGIDGRGNWTVKVLDADSKNPKFSIGNDFINELKQSSLINMKDSKSYSINLEEAKRVQKIYEELKELDSKEELGAKGENLLRDFLDSFGFKVQDGVILSLLNPEFIGSTVALFSAQGNGVLDVLNNNLTAQLKKQEAGETLSFGEREKDSTDPGNISIYNNSSNFNEIIRQEELLTFNPQISTYIAHKTINKYEQPKFISEHLKKLLNPNDKSLLIDLSQAHYSQNSMVVQMLKRYTRPENNLSLKVKLGLASLNVIKKSGENEESGEISELSLKDYFVSIFGFFAHTEEELKAMERKVGNESLSVRLAYMPFPAISDTGSMPLWSTVVYNLTKDNFIFDGSGKMTFSNTVLEELYSQLVKPDLDRLDAYLRSGATTNIEGHDTGAAQIQGIPGLNGLVIKDKNGNNTTLLAALQQSIFNPGISGNYANVNDVLSSNKEAIKTYMANNIQQEIDSILSFDINGNVKGLVAENGLWQDGSLKGIDKKYLDSRGTGISEKQKAQIAVADFVINSMVNQANIQMIFGGDLANYAKDNPKYEGKNIFINGDTSKINPEVINALAKRDVPVDDLSFHSRAYEEAGKQMGINLSKRLKEYISPGNRLANSFGKDSIQIMLSDKEVSSAQLLFYTRSLYPKEWRRYQKDVEDFVTLDNMRPEDRTETIEVEGIILSKYEYLKDKIKKELPKVAPYMRINNTDAQEYVTWREHINQLIEQGRLKQDMADQISKKLEDQTKKGVNKNNKLSEEENKVVMGPTKPLYAGLHFEKYGTGDNVYNAQRYVYIKSASFPLTPELTAAFPDLDLLRQNIERIQSQNKDKTVRVSYNSANKVGAIKNAQPVTSLYRAMSEEEIREFGENNSLVLKKENFSIQQDKPFHTDHDIEDGIREQINMGTQIEDILLGNGINLIEEQVFPSKFDDKLLSDLRIIKSEEGNISGKDLAKIYNHLAEQQQKLLKNKLLRKFGISSFSNLNNKNIHAFEKIANELNKRLSNRQDQDGITLVYKCNDSTGNIVFLSKEEMTRRNLTPSSVDFKIPIWMLPNSTKFESVLNSIINNNSINLKISGFSGPVGSQAGFKTRKKTFAQYLADGGDAGVIFTDSWNEETGLTSSRYENDNLKHFQILAPNKFRINKTREDGTTYQELINMEDYINPETGRIDNSKLPKELLEMFSFRIPTSSHQSGCLVEIVGFLPHDAGDLIIVPGESTIQIGEDYDIDIRNFYMLNTINDSEGNLRAISSNDINTNLEESLTKLQEDYKLYKAGLIQNVKGIQNSIWLNNQEDIAEMAILEWILDTVYNDKSTNNLVDAVLNNASNIKESDTNSSSEVEIAEIKAKIEELKSTILPQTRVKEEQAKYNQQLEESLAAIREGFVEEKNNLYQEINKNSKLLEQYIENQIINTYISVYSSTDSRVTSLINQALNTDFAEGTAEAIDKAYSGENSGFSVFKPIYQQRVMNLGASGKLGISVHSNWVTFNSIMQQFSTKENPIKIGGLNLRFGNLQTDGTLGKINSDAFVPGKEPKGYTPRPIAVVNMENQNSATDNQKLQIMGRRNENRHTINAFSLMCNLGLDSDGLKVNGTVLSYPSLFISQPIIKDYVRLMEYYSSMTTMDIFNVQKAVRDELQKLYGKNAGLNKEGKMNSEVKDNLLSEATSQRLYSELVNPTGNLQWALFENFEALNDTGQKIIELQSAFNIENGGLGISFFDTINKKEFLEYGIQNMEIDFPGISRLIGDFKDIRNESQENEGSKEVRERLIKEGYIEISSNSNVMIKPETYFGHKIVNSITQGYNLWKNIFPFDEPVIRNQIQTIIDSSNVFPGSKAETELKYKIIRNMQDYVYSNMSELFGTSDVNSLREQLMLDTNTNQSLASVLQALRSAKHPLMSEPFFRDLSIQLNRNDSPSIITYNKSTTNAIQKNAVYKILNRYHRNNETISLNGSPLMVNGKSITYKELIKKLVQYSFLSNQEGGAIGFRNQFPLEIFDEYGVTDNLVRNTGVKNTMAHNMLYNGVIQSVINNVGELDTSSNIIKNYDGLSEESIEVYVNLINRKFGEGTASILPSNDIQLSKPVGESSNFVRQYFQHNIGDARVLPYKEKRRILSRLRANSMKDIISFGVSKNYLPDYLQADGVLFERRGSFYHRVNELGGFGINEFNVTGENNISIFSDNNYTTEGKISESVSPIEEVEEKETQPKQKTAIEYVAAVAEKEGEFQALAKFLLPYIEKDVRLVQQTLIPGVDGVYDVENKVIFVSNTIHPNSIVPVILEEVLHSITRSSVDKDFSVDVVNGNLKFTFSETASAYSRTMAKVYQEGWNAIKNHLSKKLGSEEAALNQINSVMDRVSEAKKALIENKSYNLNLNEDEHLIYRASNIHEFLAGMFFNPEFQEILNNTEYLKSKKSIFDKFIELLSRVLPELKDNHLLKASIEALVGYLEDTQTTTKEKMNELKKAADKIDSTESEIRKLMMDQDSNDPDSNLMNKKSQAIEFINHSGGAYGGDTFWDLIGREFGVINHKHYRDAGNANLSQQLRNKGIKAEILTKEQMNFARQKVKELLGVEYEDDLKGNLQVRNFYQVYNSDAVYAVAKIASSTKPEVYGGTDTAVQLGIKLNKPVYVWDIDSEQWYTQDTDFLKTGFDKTKHEWNYNGWKKIETPTLTRNFAGIGSRDIENYNVQKDGKWQPREEYVGKEKENAAKQAIRDVYEKTFNTQMTDTLLLSPELANAVYETLLKEGKIENQGYTLTLEEFNSMTKEEQDNFIKCL